MNAVQQLCPRSLLLNGGKIHAFGPTDEVITQHLNSNLNYQDQTSFERPDSPPKDIYIKSVRLLHDNQPSNDFRFNDTMSVHIEVTANKPFTGVAYELIIRDQNGYPIIFLPSALRFGTTFTIDPGTTNLTCDIQSLPLAEGAYYLDTMLADSRSFLDYVQAGIKFIVSQSDPGEIGKSFRQTAGQGCIHLEARFRKV
jgi:hypothetical protein